MRKNFKSYALGLFFDRLGNALYTVVLPLLLYTKSESLLVLTLALLSQIMPRVFSFVIVGTFVDGMNRRKIFFNALIVQAVASFIMGYLSQFNLTVSIYLFLSIIISIAFEFSRSCERALVPVMFKDNISKANSILASIFSFCFILGPLLTFFLSERIGHSYILYFNSFTFLVPIFLSKWSLIPNYVPKDAVTSTAEVLQSFKEGLLYTFKNNGLILLLLISMIISFATAGTEPIIIFSLKRLFDYGDNTVSLLFLFEGIGMFLASVVSAKFLSDEIRVKGLLTGSLLLLIFVNFVFTLKNYVNPILTFTIYSFVLFFVSLFLDIYLQNNIPTQYFGRVSSFFRISRQGGTSVSLLLIPQLFTAFGYNGVFIFSSLIILLGVVLYIAMSMRNT